MNPELVIRSKGHTPLRIGLGEELEIAGGVGGWARITRPRRQSLTEWQGYEGREMRVPVIFDGFADDRSVEREIRQLEKFGRKGRGDNHPPVLTLKGPIPHSDLDWVIQDIEWGRFDRRTDGQRIRQHATIIFWDFVDADITIKRKRSPAKKSRDRNRGGKGQNDNKGSRRTYTVKRGDTLSSIAARRLGDSSLWRKIADLNDIRDPKRIRVGQVLRLP